MSAFPTGTVTFLFTDLEGSTRLWEEHPEAMKVALARHDVILREEVERCGGRVIKATGDGLHAVFDAAQDSVAAAIGAERALAEERWDATGPLRVRMGLHTGEADYRAGDYYGPVLNRAARLAGAAHGGQILVSHATEEVLRDHLGEDLSLVDLGEHRLRDLSRPERIFQLWGPGVSHDFPPLRSLDAFPGNLPVERTALIGRTRELRGLAEVLNEHRLVTLTGVGGVGKTRVAVQVAADVVHRFPDGAWLVALESIRDPVLVPGVVAAALDIAERPGRPVSETLRDAIGCRELLVVLDNCEHLLDASARLVDGLLDACPGVRMVATSREALGVEGEQSWPIPSLRLPEAGADLEDVAGAEAVALFVERAQAVRPDFELSPANAESVTALCARLDGIPLAIELAAARVSALTPKDIVERIDQRFLLLTGGSRTALERHQTLQAAVDWSYDLLEDPERRFFMRLSVFAGGFTLDAAWAVAADENTGELVVLDLIDSLVAKSIVLAEGSGASARYRLLETLRQYARDRLAATGDAAATRARHARYYLEFAEALRPSIFGPDQLAAWDREDTELGNLRAAFNWMLETGDGAGALQLVGTLFGEGSDTGELLRLRLAALDASAGLPPGERAEPLAWTAFAALGAGEHTRASELAEASLACARDANIAPHPRAFEALGLVAFWRRQPALAVKNLELAVAQAKRADDGSPLARWWIASALMQLCFVLGQTGEPERAIVSGEEALSNARNLGMPTLLSAALFNVALACRSTDPRRAARLIDESLERSISIGARWPFQRAWTLIAAGQVHGTLGDHDRALGAFAEVLTLARQTGERFVVPLALQGIARALRHRHRPDQAARLLAASQHLAEDLDIPGGPADVASRDRAFVRLRELLGTERFDAEVEAGTALSFDAALTSGVDIATAAQRAAQPTARPSPSAARPT